MPTQAELNAINDASRKRQQSRRGIEQPAEPQQAEEQEPYVNPYRSRYGTDSIEKKEPRIGDEVNFDEISVPGSNDDTYVPDGRAYNDILFWSSEWTTLSPLASSGSAQNLQIIDGNLEWVEFVKVLAGVNNNDILRWDGEAWVSLDAPASSEDPLALTIENGSMSWQNTGLPEGVSNNDILRFNGTNWVVQDAPASSTNPLALTIENGSMSWDEASVSGFTEETIDYVTSANAASSKIFLTKEVPV